MSDADICMALTPIDIDICDNQCPTYRYNANTRCSCRSTLNEIIATIINQAEDILLEE